MSQPGNRALLIAWSSATYCLAVVCPNRATGMPGCLVAWLLIHWPGYAITHVEELALYQRSSAGKAKTVLDLRCNSMDVCFNGLRLNAERLRLQVESR